MARRGRPPLGPATEGRAAIRLSESAELALAASIAEAHYLSDTSIVQIAHEHGLTRFQVSRLLQLARQSGMVSITVTQPARVDRELGSEVQRVLDVERVIVVSGGVGSPWEKIGPVLAETVSATVSSGDVVGLTWSRTLVAMSQHLHSLEPCTIVQLTGHMASGISSPGSVEVVRRAAHASGGTAYPIYSPLLSPDAYVARAVSQQPDTRTAMSLYDSLTLAVVSIGAWRGASSSIFDAVSEEERAAGVAAGVVGEVGGRLFDAEGRPVPEVIDDRVIGISLGQLGRARHVIASSYGADRVDATRAAASADLVDTLVIDRALALALIANPPEAGTTPPLV